MGEMEIVSRCIEFAKAPEDVFGVVSGTRDEKMVSVKEAYRRLVLVVHPDHHVGKPTATQAQELFVRLTSLKADAETKISDGSYGDGKPVVPPPPDPPPTMVTVGKKKYVVGKRLAEGDICDVYRCEFEQPVEVKTDPTTVPSLWDRLLDDAGTVVDGVLKIAQSADDNDLVERESKILRSLYPTKQADEKFYRYLPRLFDSFMVKSAGSSPRRANVFPRLKEYRGLDEVLRVYPKGLDYQDVVWMLKRSFAGIGFVHVQGIVHGALVPPHIMVDPLGHGAKFIDWCYAIDCKATPTAHVPALAAAYRHFYAPEIPAKKPVTPSTDIFMIAKCVVAILGGDVRRNEMPTTVPVQFRRFIETCLIEHPSRRPKDAWALHEELDQLLLKIVGKPKYRPLSMPARD